MRPNELFPDPTEHSIFTRDYLIRMEYGGEPIEYKFSFPQFCINYNNMSFIDYLWMHVAGILFSNDWCPQENYHLHLFIFDNVDWVEIHGDLTEEESNEII
jgi:hypothetical protein